MASATSTTETTGTEAKIGKDKSDTPQSSKPAPHLQMGQMAMWKHYFADKKRSRNGIRVPEEDEDISGKIVVITGCNIGIGKATAIEMAKKGATIIMACRNISKAQEAKDNIAKIVKDAQIDILELDLSDLDSVKKFVEEFTGKYPHLNILINNAGIAEDSGTLRYTKQDFEFNMGVNHLGPFLLTVSLIGHLKKGAPSRVVTVASGLHVRSQLDLDDIMLKKKAATARKVKEYPYANSKLANILFTRELAKRLDGSGVRTYAVCPGLVKTEITTGQKSFLVKTMGNILLSLVGLTPEEGSRTSVHCAVSKLCSEDTGKMYRFCKMWPEVTEAINDDFAKQFWIKSEEFVGIT